MKKVLLILVMVSSGVSLLHGQGACFLCKGVSFTSADTVLTCLTDSVQLKGLPGGIRSYGFIDTVIYNWSGPSGFSVVDTALISPAAVISDSGAPPQQVVLDSSSIWVQNPGTYTLLTTIVYNNDGVMFTCTCTDNILVTQETTPPTTNPITGGSSFCTGGNTILTAPSAPVGRSYSYQWSPPGSSPASNRSFTINTQGNYKVVVTDDDNGCKDSTMVFVTENPLPTTSPITGNPSFCAGGNTILTAPSAPVGRSYSYQWSPPVSSPTSNRSFTINAQGNYKVVVTDNGTGCKDSTMVFVTENPLPTTNPITGDPSFCEGDNTSLTAPAAPMGRSYSYQWSPPGSSPATNQSFTINTQGNYKVVVTDNTTGCKDSAMVSVTENPLPTTNPITGDPSFCTGDSTILTAPSAPVGRSYSYQWSPPGSSPASNQSFTINVQDTYKVVVTDNATGCKDSAMISVTENPLPILDIGTPGGTRICPGQGCVDLVASGAGTSGTYIWNTGSSLQTINVCNSGTYTVTGTDVNGCENSKSVDITDFTLPAVSITASTDSICEGQESSQLIANPSGNGPFTYTWTGGLASQGTVQVFASGAYTVTIEDRNNCIASSSRTVSAKKIPNAELSPIDTLICDGQETTPLTARGGGTYAWQVPGNPNGPTTSTITASDIGTYTVVVTNGGGCKDTAKAIVRGEQPPTILIESTPPVCQGEMTTLSSRLVDGPYTQIQYSWETRTDGGAWQPIPGANSDEYTTPILFGDTDYRVTVSTKCSPSATAEATVSVISQPSPSISGPAQVCRGQEAFYFVKGDSALFPFSEFSWTVNGGTIRKVIREGDSLAIIIKWGDTSGNFDLELKQKIGQCFGLATLAVDISTDEVATGTCDLDAYDINRIFICTNPDVECYQWGYYNPLDNTNNVLEGETYQAYAAGSAFNPNWNYWVQTWDGDCGQASGCTNVSFLRISEVIEDEDFPPSLQLYPNPNQGHFQIKLGELPAGNYQVLIVDHSGREIMRRYVDIEDGNLDEDVWVNTVTSGLFSCIILNQEGVYASKLFMITKK